MKVLILMTFLMTSLNTYSGPYELGNGGSNNLRPSEKMGVGESSLSLNSFGLNDDNDLKAYVEDAGYVACKLEGAIINALRTKNGKVGARIKGMDPTVSGKMAITNSKGFAKLVLGPNALISYPTENYLLRATGGHCKVSGKNIDAGYGSVVATKYVPYRNFYNLSVTMYVNPKDLDGSPVFFIDLVD